MTTPVACLGLAVLDVVQRVDSPPAWGGKGVARSVEVTAGGPAANAAITCAAAGVPVTLITALGDSPQASLVRAECQARGVTVIDLLGGAGGAGEDGPPAGPGPEAAGASWQLPVASCVVDAAGERTVVSAGAGATPFGLTPAARAALAGAGVLLLDGHHPVAAGQALRARPPGCRAVLDAGSVKPHAESWLSLLDVVAGSADYVAGLAAARSGQDGPAPGGPGSPAQRRALAHVLGRGAGAAVLTAGAGPVVWAEASGRSGSVRPPRVPHPADTLGAGDAWHGAFIAALATGADLPAAVRYACQAAAARVRQEGARSWLARVRPPAAP